MGNAMKRNQGVQMVPQQGGMYVAYQQPPMVQQQAVVRPVAQQQPMMVQQQPPMMMQQPSMMMQQPPMMVQQTQPAVVQPTAFAPQQSYYRPAFPSAPSMPRYPVPQSQLSLPTGQNPAQFFENDSFLANLTGWSPQDIERLRHEFLSYANQFGVIDRDGFRKLYVASLLNMTWEMVEHDAEQAFRNFDINQTGFLDFNEYITACSRMARETTGQFSGPAPPPLSMNPSYNY